MAWGTTYTASADYAAGTTTGTWMNSAGVAMTLPAIPSGSSGMVHLTRSALGAIPSAIVTALSTTSWGVDQIEAAEVGVIRAIVGASIIA